MREGGLLENKMNIFANQNCLSSARETIKTLTPDDLKNISKLKVIEKLNSVIGNDSSAGAGTNGDRAEALALKASIYRLGVIEAEKSETVKVKESTPATTGTQTKKTTETPSKTTNPLLAITADQIATIMAANPKCDCGSNCDEYAKYISTYSAQYGIDDPLRILAIMIQESGCKYNAHSSSGSYGLMQINGVSFNDVCKNELSSESGGNFPNSIFGSENVEQNIECGIEILKAKYMEYHNGVERSQSWIKNDKFRNIVNPCITYNGYGSYTKWDAALRAYNGWGCGTGADVHYVEKVNKIFSQLKIKSTSVSA